MRISDWSSDVCSSDLAVAQGREGCRQGAHRRCRPAARHAVQTLKPGSGPEAGTDPSSFSLVPQQPTNERSNDPFSAEDENRHRESRDRARSEEHTSELQSLMRISSAVFCLKKKKQPQHQKQQ